MMDYKRQKVSTIHFWLARMYQFSGSHAESLGFKIWIIHATGNIFLFCKLFTLGSYFHYMEIFLFLDFTKILSVQNFSLARSFASIWPCHDPFANQVLSEISKLPILSVEQLSKLSMTNRLHTVPNVRTNKKKPKKKTTKNLSLRGACICSKRRIWLPSVRLTYQNHWSDSRVIQQVFRNYYSLPCQDGLRL